MQQHIDQIKHNDHFHQCMVEKFEGLFYDWKVTVLFYTAVHCLKALAVKVSKDRRKEGKDPVDLGETHQATMRAISQHGDMPIKEHARRAYRGLLDDSYKARYHGIRNPEMFTEDFKRDYEVSLARLVEFKKYVTGRGVPIPNVDAAEV